MKLCEMAQEFAILPMNPRQIKRFALAASSLVKRKKSLFDHKKAQANDDLEQIDQTFFYAFTLSIYTYLFFPRLHEVLITHDFMIHLVDALTITDLETQGKRYKVLQTISFSEKPEPSSPEFFRAREIVIQLHQSGVNSLRNYTIT